MTDQEFETLLNDPDNKRIINDACRRFPGIPPEELEQIKALAVWKAATRPRDRAKFTTVLYQRIRWELLDYRRSEARLKRRAIKPDSIAKSFIDEADWLDEVDDLPQDLRNMVYDRFYAGMTYQELAEKYGMCPMSASRRVKLGLLRLNVSLNKPIGC